MISSSSRSAGQTSGTPWSALQDILLIKAREQHADKWVAVSNSVPGKSPVECAERYKELASQGVVSVEDVTTAHKSSTSKSNNKSASAKRIRSTTGPRLAPLEEQKRVENLRKPPRPPKSISGSSSRSKARKREPLKVLQIQSSPIRGHFDSDSLFSFPDEPDIQTTRKSRNGRRGLATSPIRSAHTRPSVSIPLFSDPQQDSFDQTQRFLASRLDHEFANSNGDQENDNLLHEFFMLDEFATSNTDSSALRKEKQRRELIPGFTPTEHDSAPLFPDTSSSTATQTQAVSSHLAPLTPVTELVTDPILPTFPHSSELGDIFFSEMDIFRPVTNLQLNDSMPNDNDAFLDEIFKGIRDESAQCLSLIDSHAQDSMISDDHIPTTKSQGNRNDFFRFDIDDILGNSFEQVQQVPAKTENPKVVFEPDWISGPSGVFSSDQLDRLKHQLGLSLQISVQAYTHHAIVDGVQDQNTIFWEEQIMRQAKVGKEFVLWDKKGGAEDISALAHAESLVKDINGSTKNGTTVPGKIALKYAKLLESHFDSAWKVPLLSHSETPRSEGAFTPEEDELLFWGVFHHGIEAIPSIRSFYLPARSYEEIKNRLDEATDIKSTQMKLKDLHSMPFKPLTIVQKHYLQKGIERFGYTFKDMLPTLFPDTPSLLVEIAWDELFAAKSVSIPWSSDRIVLPKSAIPFTTSTSAMANGKSVQQSVSGNISQAESIASSPSRNNSKKQRKQGSYISADENNSKYYSNSRHIVSSPLAYGSGAPRHSNVKEANEMLFESRANLRMKPTLSPLAHPTLIGQEVDSSSNLLRRQIGKRHGHVEILSDHHIVTKPVLKNRNRESKSTSKTSKRTTNGNRHADHRAVASDCAPLFGSQLTDPRYLLSDGAVSKTKLRRAGLALPSDDGYLASCQSSEPDALLPFSTTTLAAMIEDTRTDSTKSRNELAEALLCRWNSDFETDLEGVASTSTKKSRTSRETEPPKTGSTAIQRNGVAMSRISEEDTEDGQFPKVDFTGLYDCEEESGDEQDTINTGSATLPIELESFPSALCASVPAAKEDTESGKPSSMYPKGVGRAGQRRTGLRSKRDLVGDNQDDESVTLPLTKRSRRCFKKRSHSSHTSSSKSKHKARKKQKPHALTESYSASDLITTRQRHTQSPVHSEPVYISPDHMDDFFK